MKIGGAGGGSLPEMAREIMLSVADAGVHIEVCPAAVGVCPIYTCYVGGTRYPFDGSRTTKQLVDRIFGFVANLIYS